MHLRIGQGYDIHRLTLEKPLVIGGHHINHAPGSLAHSDGDILIHALIDALLGALALGDIGSYFPDSSNDYKDISSEVLLKRTLELPNFSDYKIINIDSTIHFQAARLAPHILSIRKSLAKILNININQISVKAKTAENCGEIGHNLAIACDVIILLTK